jgi:hypothetical protein
MRPCTVSPLLEGARLSVNISNLRQPAFGVLNQIGRRLTERLEGDPGKRRKHQLLMMLDEFPALDRLDFFETALAFMAGYGIRAYPIAQSLNQISKAYGENNAILDNCHVRIAFSSNDERTAKCISDARGTATEIRAQRNYAGHRLATSNGTRGLWDRWRSKDKSETKEKFTIVTTEPSKFAVQFHNRMPLFLEPDTWDL